MITVIDGEYLPQRDAISAFIGSFAGDILFVDDGGLIETHHTDWAAKAARASGSIVAVVSTADRGRWLTNQAYCDEVWDTQAS